MIVRIDHIMIAVPDLARGIEHYARLGFDIHPGGVHPGKGTHNAIAFNRDDYIELIAVRDAAEYRAARGPAPDSGLIGFVEAGGGIRYIALQTDDLAAEVAGMRARGVDVSDPREGGRVTPAGQSLRWRTATLGAQNPLPILFIEHLTSIDVRRSQVTDRGANPNGVYTLERAYIVTADALSAAERYASVLGIAVPPRQRGTVIMSDMCVFQIGPTGLGIAQPYAPGPGADALARRGPGPFQALYRTTSMGAAARWMEAHGMPPLARGVRNTGEQAMLALPADACGACIGFVGPE